MHLVVDLSAHGFGHIAQTAPVLEELSRRLPQLTLTIRSAAPTQVLARRISCRFRHISQANDVGMAMKSALDLDLEQSWSAYRAFHRDWEDKVQRETEALGALHPDLLLANVPYLSLAAAKQARIEAVAMCSLNWADIFMHYFSAEPDGASLYGEILDAYDCVACFLKLTPGMNMPELRATRKVGPIAQVGKNRRAEITRRLKLSGDEKLVLLGLGGIAIRLPVERWPRMRGMRWLVEKAWSVNHPDAIVLESLELPFPDLLASCDALITKPGYGAFTEAACNGIPVLYVDRPDWPEAAYLNAWLREYGECLEIDRAALMRGEFEKVLQTLLARPRRATISPTGITEVADFLVSRLMAPVA